MAIIASMGHKSVLWEPIKSQESHSRLTQVILLATRYSIHWIATSTAKPFLTVPLRALLPKGSFQAFGNCSVLFWNLIPRTANWVPLLPCPEVSPVSLTSMLDLQSF